MNKKPSINWLLLLLLFTGNIASGQERTVPDVLMVQQQINKVVDKVIRETRFELVPYWQKSKPFFQHVDMQGYKEAKAGDVVYARSTIFSEQDGVYQLGIASGSPLEIRVNGKRIFKSERPIPGTFKEIAYDIYSFPKTMAIHLQKGNNQILVKSYFSEKWSFSLGIMDKNNRPPEGVSFIPEPAVKNNPSNWILCGVFASSDSISNEVFPPENEILSYYTFRGQLYNWTAPPQNVLLKNEIPPDATFQKHSYAEWHYSTGVTLWSILRYAIETDNMKYAAFVKQYCKFTNEHYPYFKYQYNELGEIHGFNHRMIRMHMLDDAPAPALPFALLASDGECELRDHLIDSIAEYVMHGQTRLTDGTLCRPEPEEETLWADDLFMSAPFLMMFAKLSGDSSYIDEAAFQAVQFYHYLLDEESGLAHHGWFSATEKPSAAYWSRANGWLIWGLTEVLQQLPVSHKYYAELLDDYRHHIEGFIKVQQSDGMFCQLLNEPETFHESSSTAMFILAVSRGVYNGWLPESYLNFAIRGWEGISKKILDDGTVTGICQGTGISDELDDYRHRKTPGHDPRGVGAVITAGLELNKAIVKSNNAKN